MSPVRSIFSVGVAVTTLTRYLELASWIFLGFPVTLFLLGWVKWWIAWPIIIGIVCTVRKIWTKHFVEYGQEDISSQRTSFSYVSLIICFFITALWAGHSGAGGFAYRTNDWLKHFAVLEDLSIHQWPVVYALPDHTEPVSLVYYSAYYLPSALIEKLFGWASSCYFWQFFTMSGVVLAVFWVAVLVGRSPWKIAFIFPLLGGLDFIGTFLTQGKFMPWDYHHEWWVGLPVMQYSATSSLLVWVPQHALPGWIGTCLFMFYAKKQRGLRYLGLIMGFITLWSPFVFLGLIPFVFLEILKALRKSLWWDIVSPANSLGIVIAAITTLYLYTQGNEIPTGWLWKYWDIQTNWYLLILFYLFEFGFFFILSTEVWHSKVTPWRSWGILTFILLLIIPWYHMGIYNDFVMRASIPAITVMWVFLLRDLLLYPFRGTVKVLAILMVLAGFTGATEIMRALGSFQLKNPLPKSEVVSVWQLDKSLRVQYEGRTDSFFWRFLARPWSPQIIQVK
jgi:hypothetical protein